MGQATVRTSVAPEGGCRRTRNKILHVRHQFHSSHTCSFWGGSWNPFRGVGLPDDERGLNRKIKTENTLEPPEGVEESAGNRLSTGGLITEEGRDRKIIEHTNRGGDAQRPTL